MRKLLEVMSHRHRKRSPSDRYIGQSKRMESFSIFTFVLLKMNAMHSIAHILPEVSVTKTRVQFGLISGEHMTYIQQMKHKSR